MYTFIEQLNIKVLQLPSVDNEEKDCKATNTLKLRMNEVCIG